MSGAGLKLFSPRSFPKRIGKTREPVPQVAGPAQVPSSIGSPLLAIPIAVAMPVAFALPALAFAPTPFASFAKFVALMVGLTAVKAVTIDFALELPFVLLDVALAPAKVVRCSAACGTEQEKPT